MAIGFFTKNKTNLSSETREGLRKMSQQNNWQPRTTETGGVRFGEITVSEKIQRARKIGASDTQIANYLVGKTNLGEKIQEARKIGASDTQILNRFISYENPQPVSKKESQSIIKTIIKEEMGAVDTITAPLFFKAAEESVKKSVAAQNKLTTLYKSLPEGKGKERLGNILKKNAKESPILRFEKVVPTADKSTSQALGEAVMLGLLIAPGVGATKKIATTAYTGIIGREAAALATSSTIKTFYKNLGKGMASGAAMGATIGVAQEGELDEKAPTIAAMTGFGAIGGGVITGVLPPIVKLVGSGAKSVLSRVVGKIDDKVVAPTIRYVDRKVGKATTRKAVDVSLGGIDAEIKRLNNKIKTAYKKIDNAFYSGKTKKQMEVFARDISGFNKEIARLENKRTKLLNKTIFKDLSAGDKIFNKDIGIFRVKEIRTTLGGEFFVMGEDVNGRIVTIMPDDLLKMKKIIPQSIKEVTEVIGLPKLAAVPIKQGKPSKIIGGLKSAVQTTSKMISGMGDSGRAFVRVLDETIDTIDRRVGSFQNDMATIIQKHNLTKKPFTPKEIKNIIDILDSGIKFKAKNISQIPIKPINNRVSDFLEVFSKATIGLGDEFDKIGGRIRSADKKGYHKIIERYIHLPHIPKDIDALKAAAPEIAEKISKRQGLSKREANALVNDFIKQFYTRRYAGLEKSRTLFLDGYDELLKYGYETNPLTIFDDFVEGSVRRIEEIKAFGRNDEIIAHLIKQVGEDGYDSGLVQKVWNRIRGDVEPVSNKALTDALKTWQVVGKLPLAAVINSTQVVNTASEFGVKNTLRSFKVFMKNKIGAKEAARLSGVRDDLITRAMEMAGAETKLAGSFLRKVGFTKVEKFNRIITTVAAQEWAQDSLKFLQKNQDDIRILRHFKQLGFDSSDVRRILQRGRFSQNELNKIGQAAVKSTQFRGSALDIPLLWSSDWGKVVTQFKSFAWQQGAFVKRKIIDEALQGNMAPLITYSALSQVTGESVRDIRDFMKGDFDFRRDEDIISRIIDNQLTVGGFGLAGDLFYSMFERASGKFYITTSDFIMGPTASDAASFVDSLADMLGGRFKTITNFATTESAKLAMLPKVRNIPGSQVMLRVIADIIKTINKEN